MNSKRNRLITFWVSDEEYDLINRKMECAGISNQSSFLRKMAIDGMVIKLDLPELRQLSALLGRSAGNFNQIAKRINSTNRVYDADIDELRKELDDIWKKANEILLVLSKLS